MSRRHAALLGSLLVWHATARQATPLDKPMLWRTKGQQTIQVDMMEQAMEQPMDLTVGNNGVVIDPKADGKARYDGHGALSAGASSRLLFDYAEPMRSQILDYLYTPKFGASMHLVKVEIGGDSQSTDGTEASHMHSRNDLNCNRGYEWWLLKEARKRNPDVVTYALSWAVPAWVGNDNYFSDDNIGYQVAWLKCARDAHPEIGEINYIGMWNEKAWGKPDYIKKLRKAMDDSGFSSTSIVLPDGKFDAKVHESILSAMDNDADFSKALAGGAIGLHYPCNDQNVSTHPDVQGHGLKFWSSEDFSSEAGTWDGASCWGRILNRNFVKYGMTSVISWAMTWSAYDDWPWYGSGFVYALSPWSGHYDVTPALWTTAHHCQFYSPGWSYVGGRGGRGELPLGGSYVALMDPREKDVSIVIEKLFGKCSKGLLRACRGTQPFAESVTFTLAGSLRNAGRPHPRRFLSAWISNQTHQFVRLPDVPVDPDTGSFTVYMAAESIMTLTSTSGQQKGTVPSIPQLQEFPLPYKDSFESNAVGQMPRYFSDNGGSFEIAMDPLREGNQVLSQVVAPPPNHNKWGANVEGAITVLGDASWKDIRLSADVMIPVVAHDETLSMVTINSLAASLHTPKYAGLCVHVSGGGPKQLRGHCFNVYMESGSWSIEEDGLKLKSGALPSSVESGGLSGVWHKISLQSRGDMLEAWVDDILIESATIPANSRRHGRAALVTGWNRAFFDNFVAAPEGSLLSYDNNQMLRTRHSLVPRWNVTRSI